MLESKDAILWAMTEYCCKRIDVENPNVLTIRLNVTIKEVKIENIRS